MEVLNRHVLKDMLKVCVMCTVTHVCDDNELLINQWTFYITLSAKLSPLYVIIAHNKQYRIKRPKLPNKNT
jgi:hypothetical protein